MPKDSIALIGFMATGKTIIGKALVIRLGKDYKLIETDQLIVQETGKQIPQILEEEGEDKFRELEVSICKKISKLRRVVISCGGGVVLNPLNINNLRKNCHIILLTASTEEIYERITKNGTKSRPLINKKEPMEEIKKILTYRNPLYKSAADVIIDTSRRSINEIVDSILIELKKLNQ